MFANSFQSGFLSIFYSVGSSPLSIWDKQVKNGHIRRVVDDEVKSLVLEISGTNVATTYITCPIKPRASLGIKLPFLVMIIKNMKKYFTFEIQILDDKDMHRRFRVSNFQSTTKVRPFCTTMPIGLSSGWNQIQFNLADFTKRAYGSTYIETTRVQIHANVRIRRVYFADMLYSDDEMPNEFKLFVPVPGVRRNVPQKAQPKKELFSKAEQEEKKLSDNEMKIQIAEQEIPSGAPPSPADPTRLEEDLPPIEENLESPISVEPESTDAIIDEAPPGDTPIDTATTDDVGGEAEADAKIGLSPVENGEIIDNDEATIEKPIADDVEPPAEIVIAPDEEGEVAPPAENPTPEISPPTEEASPEIVAASADELPAEEE